MNQANNKDNLEKYKERQLGSHKADNYQLVIERIKKTNQFYGYNRMIISIIFQKIINHLSGKIAKKLFFLYFFKVLWYNVCIF